MQFNNGDWRGEKMKFHYVKSIETFNSITNKLLICINYFFLG